MAWIAKYWTARPFSKCCDNHDTPAHNHAPSHAPTHRHEHTELLAILTAHGAVQHGTGARGHTRPPPPGAHPSLATAVVEPLVGAVGSRAALQPMLGGAAMRSRRASKREWHAVPRWRVAAGAQSHAPWQVVARGTKEARAPSVRVKEARATDNAHCSSRAGFHCRPPVARVTRRRRAAA